MMMSTTTTTYSVSPPNLLLLKTKFIKPKHIFLSSQITKCFRNFSTTSSSYPPHISQLTLSKHPLSYTFLTKPTRTTLLRASAAAADNAVVPTDDATQQILSAATTSSSGDDGVSVIISGLLLIAFIALSVLTIGVVYIGVTDFLQKREKDRFEKEEEAKAKKKGGKKKVAARARDGPRGFGQKIEQDFDD